MKRRVGLARNGALPCGNFGRPRELLAAASNAFSRRPSLDLSPPRGPTTHPTHNALSENIRTQTVKLLNKHLAAAIDLHGQLKQAHRNVRGPAFIGVHVLFARRDACDPASGRRSAFAAGLNRDTPDGALGQAEAAAVCEAALLVDPDYLNLFGGLLCQSALGPLAEQQMPASERPGLNWVLINNLCIVRTRSAFRDRRRERPLLARHHFSGPSIFTRGLPQRACHRR